MDRYVLRVGRRDGHTDTWIGLNDLLTEDPLGAWVFRTHTEAMQRGVGVPVLLAEHLRQYGSRLTKERCRNSVAGHILARKIG